MVPDVEPLAFRIWGYKGVLMKVIAAILFLPLVVIDFTFFIFFLLEQILPMEKDNS